MVRQGDDVPVDLYTPAAFDNMVSDGALPAEIMPLLRLLVLGDFTKLPDSMQTKAYDIYTIDRFKFPCTQPFSEPLHSLGKQVPSVGREHCCDPCALQCSVHLPCVLH